jgi:hypothetical protein
VTTWLIGKSALVRLAAGPDAAEWAARIERGLVRITTSPGWDAQVSHPPTANAQFRCTSSSTHPRVHALAFPRRPYRNVPHRGRRGCVVHFAASKASHEIGFAKDLRISRTVAADAAAEPEP